MPRTAEVDVAGKKREGPVRLVEPVSRCREMQQQVTTVGLDLAKMVCSQRTNSA